MVWDGLGLLIGNPKPKPSTPKNPVRGIKCPQEVKSVCQSSCKQRRLAGTAEGPELHVLEGSWYLLANYNWVKIQAAARRINGSFFPLH